MTSKVVCLSHPLSPETPAYGGGEGMRIEPVTQIAAGDTANTSRLILPNHLGTHVDVPKHFFDCGKTLTDYEPDDWVFTNIQIIDLPIKDATLIKPSSIKNKIRNDVDFLIIKTGYEKFRGLKKYWDDNPGLSPELGFWLRKHFNKLRAIGFDFISLTSWKYRNVGKKAHCAFLDPEGEGSPIRIVEDMSLNHAVQNIEKVIVAPLFVEHSNGSPVTVFAKTNK